MSPIISPKKLADAIGVSESSLKRWADDGQINVSRTAGGHRRIPIGEAIRFIRAIRAPLVRPEALGLSDMPACGDPVLSTESPAERLFAHLVEGKAREARGLILSLYLSGASLAEIADGPIRSAMKRLGELWSHDSDGVFLEHRATDICIQAVEQLRLLVESPTEGPVAVGGAPTGDPYLLPSMLAATTLAADGWHVVNLGPDTPFSAMFAAVERHAPRLVWLSISSIRNLKEIEEGVAELSARLSQRGTALILGGQAAGSLPIPKHTHSQRGESLADLLTLANELRLPSCAKPEDGEASGKPRERHATCGAPAAEEPLSALLPRDPS